MTASLIKLLKEGASESYFEAMKLMNVDSKKDPREFPYQSYYKAREVLKGLLKKLNEMLGEKDGRENQVSKDQGDTVENGSASRDGSIEKEELSRLVAVVHLRLGSNHLETEELAEGEEDLQKCLKLVKDDDIMLGVKQEVLNQLGLLSSQRGDLEKSVRHLQEARMLFQQDLSAPLTPDEFFSVDAYNTSEGDKQGSSKRRSVFEDNFTHTLYFLAQVCGKLGRNSDSASYCTETLSRQLDRQTYEPLDWAMNAATLSQYYTSVGNFPMARHCLAAAETVLKEAGGCPGSLSVEVEAEESGVEVERREKGVKGWADLFRCWSKYCINLLESSRDHAYALLEKEGRVDGVKEKEEKKEVEGGERVVEEKGLNGVVEEVERLSVEKGQSFNLVVDACEGQVGAEKVLLFEEARQVFVRGQAWLARAKEFYRLDGHCSDHVELVLDHSCLFKLLYFWEDDVARQCRMHKRRADMLMEILEQLNAQFYLSLSCRLAFELGEVYSGMLDLKLAQFESQDTQTHTQSTTQTSTQTSTQTHTGRSSQAVCKINSLAHKSIAAFERYLGYLRTPQGNLPSPLSDSDERPALLAHFYIARMHSKLLSGDPRQQLANCDASLKHYNFLVDYCSKHPSGAAKVAEEQQACQEMVRLLPHKMNRIRQLL